MNKEQQELLGEAYNDYLKNGHREEGRNKDITFLPLPKNWFINLIKKDSEFSNKWGLTIEERELTESEIWSYILNNKIKIKHQHAVLSGHPIGSESRKQFIPTLKENYNIPTKLITITYKNKTIISDYE